MKIAVPIVGNEMVSQHFGHSESYLIFSISEENEIEDKESLITETSHACHSNVGEVLAEIGVGIMLVGGIGAGAINKLAASNIEVIRGCSGDATQSVELFLKGNISDSGDSCSSHEHHHEHSHDHTCHHN